MSDDKYDANLRPQMDSREGFGLYGEWPMPEIEEPTELEEEYIPQDDWDAEGYPADYCDDQPEWMQ